VYQPAYWHPQQKSNQVVLDFKVQNGASWKAPYMNSTKCWKGETELLQVQLMEFEEKDVYNMDET